jgi:hypothetical protein
MGSDRSGREGQALWGRLRESARAEGSVAEACRKAGVGRSTYYRLRAAWDGERPRAAPPKSARYKDRILRLALENPEWGCVRISFFLELQGILISSPTVQKILKAENLGKAGQRRAGGDQGARQA